jgi:hypothetical protein
MLLSVGASGEFTYQKHMALCAACFFDSIFWQGMLTLAGPELAAFSKIFYVQGEIELVLCEGSQFRVDHWGISGFTVNGAPNSANLNAEDGAEKRIDVTS